MPELKKQKNSNWKKIALGAGLGAGALGLGYFIRKNAEAQRHFNAGKLVEKLREHPVKPEEMSIGGFARYLGKKVPVQVNRAARKTVDYWAPKVKAEIKNAPLKTATDFWKDKLKKFSPKLGDERIII